MSGSGTPRGKMEASPSSKNRRTSFFGSMFGSSGRAAGTGAASSSRSSGDRDGGDIREEAPPTKFDEDEEICDEVHDMTQDELHAMDLADETLKIKDEALASLGKEIKATEEELERRIAEDDQDWAELQKPMYMHQLETISKQIESLETQIRNNNEADLAFKYDEVATDELTKEYKAHLDVLEDTKRRVLFPNSKYVLGGDGVYFAFDDFWIEFASGSFQVKLTPGENPTITITAAGKDEEIGQGKDKSVSKTGIAVRCKADSFRLAGDKGKGVPKIKFSELKLTVEVRVDVVMTFEKLKGLKTGGNLNKDKHGGEVPGAWKIQGKDFQVKLLDFKGPFGITRTLGNTILTLVRPLIRRAIMDALPVELGLVLRSLPSETIIKGNFDVVGTHLRALTSPLVGSAQYSGQACAAAGLNALQAQMFQLLQKNSMLHRYPLKTLSAIIQYRARFATRYPSLWEHVSGLWDRAIERYNMLVDQNRTTKGRSTAASATERLSFKDILLSCDAALNKPLDVRFNLQNLTSEFNLNKGLLHIYSLMKRMAEQTAAEGGPLAAAAATLSRKLGAGLQGGLDVLDMLKSNLDEAQALLRGSFHAGMDSTLNFGASNIRARLPIMLFLPLPTKIELGRRSPVEFILTVSPRPNGEIWISMDHMISDQLEKELSCRGEIDELSADVTNYLSTSTFAHGGEPSSSPPSVFSNVRPGSTVSSPVISSADATAGGGSAGARDPSSRRLSGSSVKLLLASKTFFGIRGGNKEREDMAQEKDKESARRHSLLYARGDETKGTGVVGGSPIRPAKNLKGSGAAKGVGSTKNKSVTETDGETTTEIKIETETETDTVDETQTQPHSTSVRGFSSSAGASSSTPGTLTAALEEEAQRRRAEASKKLDSHDEWKMARESRTSRVLSAFIQAPKVSLVADREAFIRADQELFTLSVHCNDDVAANPSDNPQLSALNAATVNMRTLTGVRLLVEVGRVAGFLDLPRLQLFAADLYQDLPLLKAFLEKVMGSQIDDEIMEVGATILDLSKKYILREGLDLDFNLIASVRTEAGDIIAAAGTPRGTSQADDPMTNAYLLSGTLSQKVYGNNNNGNGNNDNFGDGSDSASNLTGAGSETASVSDAVSVSGREESRQERAALNVAMAAYAAASDAGSTASPPPPPQSKLGHDMSAFQVRAKFLIADVLKDAMDVQSAITRAANVMERRNRAF